MFIDLKLVQKKKKKQINKKIVSDYSSPMYNLIVQFSIADFI